MRPFQNVKHHFIGRLENSIVNFLSPHNGRSNGVAHSKAGDKRQGLSWVGVPAKSESWQESSNASSVGPIGIVPEYCVFSSELEEATPIARCAGSDIIIDSAEKPVNIICHRHKQTLRVAK